MEKVTAKAAEWIVIPGNSKQELSKVLGIARPTLDRRLTGRSQWTWVEAKKIAELTGCTPNDLAGI